MFLLVKYKYTEFRGRYLGELHNSTKRIDAMRVWVCTCLRYTSCSACITSVVSRLCNRCIGAFAIVWSVPAYACAYGALCTERAPRLLVRLSVKRKGSSEKGSGGGLKFWLHEHFLFVTVGCFRYQNMRIIVKF